MTDRDRAGGEPAPRRSRLEDEVREILVRADQPASFTDHVRRKAQQQRRERIAGAGRVVPRIDTFGPGAFLIGCFVAAFLATLVRSSSPLLAQLLAVGSVALLAMVWVRPGSSGRSRIKQWRGRDIDLSPPPPAWMESLRDRFRRPPSR